MAGTLGFFNRPWTAFSFRRTLEGIAATGVKQMGIMRQQQKQLLGPEADEEEIAGIERDLTDFGLEFVVAYGQVEMDLPVSEASERLNRIISNIARLKGRYLLLGGTADPELYDRFLDVIVACLGHAGDKGVTIALKPHGGISATAKEIRSIVQRIDSDRFCIWFDPGNILYYTDQKPEDGLVEIAECVAGVCVKDCQVSGGEKSVMVTPGDGAVDFEAVFVSLRHAGFSGPCIVETLGGTTPEHIDAEAVRAAAFMSGILR